MIAALFVEEHGVYSGRADVECWPVERDARKYAGPWPVVAHPPCERWGNLFWTGGSRQRGDDDGCFAAALAAVETRGGVLEHPRLSGAWRAFGLRVPPKAGGWVRGTRGGWSCCVEQGSYGHLAPKATWLYYVGPVAPPALKWGRSGAPFVVTTSRRTRGPKPPEMPHPLRRATPPAFAEILLDLARLSARRGRGA